MAAVKQNVLLSSNTCIFEASQAKPCFLNTKARYAIYCAFLDAKFPSDIENTWGQKKLYRQVATWPLKAEHYSINF